MAYETVFSISALVAKLWMLRDVLPVAAKNKMTKVKCPTAVHLCWPIALLVACWPKSEKLYRLGNLRKSRQSSCLILPSNKCMAPLTHRSSSIFCLLYGNTKRVWLVLAWNVTSTLWFICLQWYKMWNVLPAKSSFGKFCSLKNLSIKTFRHWCNYDHS